MKTYTQTAVIDTIPHFPLATMRKRPVPPPNLHSVLAYRPIGLVRGSDGMRILWWQDGMIDMYDENGGHLVLYPKPTLKDAIAHSIPGDNKNSFFKFESDGAVYARWYDMNYFWSPEVESTTYERGTELVPVFIDNRWKFIYNNVKNDTDCDCYRCESAESVPDNQEHEFPGSESTSSCCGRYFCQCRDCADMIPKDS